jgi:hypothetical protein
MSECSADELAGRWVLDERGRPLGEVVGVVHHWNGRTSLLVHGGSWRSGVGMMVPVESAVFAGVDVHLDRPQPRDEHRRLLERIGEVMWPPMAAGDR